MPHFILYLFFPFSVESLHINVLDILLEGKVHNTISMCNSFPAPHPLGNPLPVQFLFLHASEVFAVIRHSKLKILFLTPPPQVISLLLLSFSSLICLEILSPSLQGFFSFEVSCNMTLQLAVVVLNVCLFTFEKSLVCFTPFHMGEQGKCVRQAIMFFLFVLDCQIVYYICM